MLDLFFHDKKERTLLELEGQAPEEELIIPSRVEPPVCPILCIIGLNSSKPWVVRFK
jgi:hypothetical protein